METINLIMNFTIGNVIRNVYDIRNGCTRNINPYAYAIMITNTNGWRMVTGAHHFKWILENIRSSKYRNKMM